MIYNLKTFHKVILAFFLLIFLTSCGYKADPRYGVEYDNATNNKTINSK
ncbi:hypothetical protein CHL_1320 [Campylobacter hyointestinalis subsp. lawsonii CCUG 27631]|nr:hypothetical protein CHL_1320 [Campylobacter hyointestinalis subsp. lawsonii CCUG 27631]QKF69122.1 hypothetical protein CHLWT_0528 [Campylobacter hyointestinalis subsp. lawsonii]